MFFAHREMINGWRGFIYKKSEASVRREWEAMEWVFTYWVEWIFGIMGMFFLALFGYFNRKLKRQKHLEEGVKALLHDRLLEACRFYTKRGWIAYEELHNVQYIYKAYHDLDGNSTGTTAFQDISDLPKQEEKNEKS